MFRWHWIPILSHPPKNASPTGEFLSIQGCLSVAKIREIRGWEIFKTASSEKLTEVTISFSSGLFLSMVTSHGECRAHARVWVSSFTAAFSNPNRTSVEIVLAGVRNWFKENQSHLMNACHLATKSSHAELAWIPVSRYQLAVLCMVPVWMQMSGVLSCASSSMITEYLLTSRFPKLCRMSQPIWKDDRCRDVAKKHQKQGMGPVWLEWFPTQCDHVQPISGINVEGCREIHNHKLRHPPSYVDLPHRLTGSLAKACRPSCTWSRCLGPFGPERDQDPSFRASGDDLEDNFKTLISWWFSGPMAVLKSDGIAHFCTSEEVYLLLSMKWTCEYARLNLSKHKDRTGNTSAQMKPGPGGVWNCLKTLDLDLSSTPI